MRRTALALLRGTDEIFYDPRHQIIYRAIQHLAASNSAVDILTITQQLSKDGALDKAGKVHYVADLTFKINSAANLQTHCLLLLELYTKRKIGEVARRMAGRAYDPMQDTFTLLSEVQQDLNDLHQVLLIKRPRLVGEIYDEVMDQLEWATQQPAGLTGVPSGLRHLDKVTGGWQPADLIIIAARPSMGKTTLVLNFAQAAATLGYTGALFTLEMRDVQLVRKLVGATANYSMSRLTRGQLRGGLDEAKMIREKAAELRTLSLFIDETSAISVGELRAKATKLKAEHDIKFIIVDYLQLMRADNQKGNREQEIASISRGLKGIAKDLNVPVLALSQLSRAVDSRDDHRPTLSDLRESGAIEQDADVVLFPYREEYYEKDKSNIDPTIEGITELILAKHRNGALETVTVRCDMKTSRFLDLDATTAHASDAGYRAENDDEDPF